MLVAPRAASRPERATRTRSSDRADRAQPAIDRNDVHTRTHPGPTSSGGPKQSDNFAKPAETAPTPPGKNGQAADAGQPVVPSMEATVQNAGLPADVLAVVGQAIVVEATGDGKPATTGDADAAAAKPQQAKDGNHDAEDAPEAETKTADSAVTIVAVAAPAPAPLNTAVADPAADPAGIAPVEVQTAAPIIPAGGTASETVPQPTAAPANITDADGTAPTVPPLAALGASQKAAPGDEDNDENQSPPVLKATGPSEPEATKPASPEPKTDSGKEKADHPDVARNTNTRPHADVTEPAPHAAIERQAKPTEQQGHPQSIEHASARARIAVAEAHPDLAVTAAASAQLNAATPNVPFLFGAPTATPLVGLWPVSALRVDPSADNTAPIAGLAVEIVARAQDGLRRFEIRLDPPELGRIDVRLDVDSGGKVTSRLTVERADTLDLLRRDAPQLERALQHAGLNTEGGLEFSLRDQNFANREQAPRDLPATRLIVPDDEQAAAEAARRGYGRLIGLGGGVDIRV